ncbi:hypothetical protein DAI22_06g122400 [Oryza sativa Japonica Group]|nr:hypothetical protein DAI22_06g122400 [Oryza sativa Japonica Group]
MSRPHASACSLGLKGGAERLPTPRFRACPAGVRRNVALPPVSVRRHSSPLGGYTGVYYGSHGRRSTAMCPCLASVPGAHARISRLLCRCET